MPNDIRNDPGVRPYVLDVANERTRVKFAQDSIESLKIGLAKLKVDLSKALDNNDEARTRFYRTQIDMWVRKLAKRNRELMIAKRNLAHAERYLEDRIRRVQNLRRGSSRG